MNIGLIINEEIKNLDITYGGVRGTTLSSRHNMRHWQTIVDSGVRTIIELRNEDHSDRLCKMCEMYGIRYFALPMDSHSVPNEIIASRLQEFFELIDSGDFYIACAMGLHRTDMALSIYWLFHYSATLNCGCSDLLCKGRVGLTIQGSPHCREARFEHRRYALTLSVLNYYLCHFSSF